MRIIQTIKVIHPSHEKLLQVLELLIKDCRVDTTICSYLLANGLTYQIG
jgi:hypothetical protein